MVLEKQILPYMQWLLYGDPDSPWAMGALPRYAVVLFGLGLLLLLLGFAIAAARRGLMRGGETTYKTVANGLIELLQTKARRVWAIARLAVKEAWRRRVVVALVVFLLVLLFANWYLGVDHEQPGRLYLSFVLTATTYLVLGVALVLSAFSLPNDFKSKTIFTVVTKPVRAGEVVLGRILGFTLVGTALLVVMALASYLFVVRSLDHTHGIQAERLQNVVGPDGATLYREGVTTREQGHDHPIELFESPQNVTEIEHDHRHRITQTADGDYVVGSAEDFIRARVPKYGKLRFIDRQGQEKDTGISVGNEWAYRSFIDGNTQARAIWTFDGVDRSTLVEFEGEEYLPLALIVDVFKTHKGVIGRPIAGAIQLRRPADPEDPDAPIVASEQIPFDAVDSQVDEQDIPRKLIDARTGEPLDLLEDLVDENERVEVWIQCLETGQYFGFAQADCYIRLLDGAPALNLAKVYMSIWVQMVLVTSIGVASSTLLNGPVALLFTVSFILLGFYRDYFVSVARGEEYGGGPVESLYRMVTQKNVMIDLEDGPGKSIIEAIDWVFEFFMKSVAQVLPDFRSFSTVRYAADGYDVPWGRVAQDLTVCGGYVLGLWLLGYFLLRTREVAK